MAATLIAPAAQVARARATGATRSVAGGNPRIGSRGPAVAAARAALGIPADGIFRPQTRLAVLAFQRAHGLEVDGVSGPITRAALGGASAAGATTIALQRALGAAADGEHGPITRAAVRNSRRPTACWSTGSPARRRSARSACRPR